MGPARRAFLLARTYRLPYALVAEPVGALRVRASSKKGHINSLRIQVRALARPRHDNGLLQHAHANRALEIVLHVGVRERRGRGRGDLRRTRRTSKSFEGRKKKNRSARCQAKAPRQGPRGTCGAGIHVPRDAGDARGPTP